MATLIAELEGLRDEMRRRHIESDAIFDRVHPSHRHSAANLLDYLTLRRRDMRQLQESLAELGLSSLGRSEEHVITTLERVLATLRLMAGNGEGHWTEAAVSYGEGRRTSENNAKALLGPAHNHRTTRILVTMPTQAADHFDLVDSLIAQGMDCARVNCAHDDREQWGRMVGHLRRAADERGRPCPILMDVPGPKLRTGPIKPGPRVLRLRPRRDAWGRPTIPARALLIDSAVTPGAPPTSAPLIPVPGPWLHGLRVGDRVHLRDTRDSRRSFAVTGVGPSGAWAEFNDTTYVTTGTLLRGDHGEATIGLLPAREQALHLRSEDLLTLTADLTAVPAEAIAPGDARIGASSVNHFRIGCSLPEAVSAVQVGHRVYFDDGRIGGEVVGVRPGEADVRITQAPNAGARLRAEKGINLPDTNLRLPALTPEDEMVLPFIVDNADIVGLSFAQGPEDIALLQDRLRQLGGSSLGIMIKVETAQGFAQLPEMLLAAMASERVGVMIARGDLAVECGFERLAEMQEEILWLCDAAHIPVIWATQVLDQMARTGRPSRAEVSDAAMAGRAECVMLNKGPHITEAVAILDNILGRMAGHQRKKVALLRRLRSWSHEPLWPAGFE